MAINCFWKVGPAKINGSSNILYFFSFLFNFDFSYIPTFSFFLKKKTNLLNNSLFSICFLVNYSFGEFLFLQKRRGVVRE